MTDEKQLLEIEAERQHSPTFVVEVRVPELIAEVRRLGAEVERLSQLRFSQMALIRRAERARIAKMLRLMAHGDIAEAVRACAEVVEALPDEP